MKSFQKFFFDFFFDFDFKFFRELKQEYLNQAKLQNLRTKMKDFLQGFRNKD